MPATKARLTPQGGHLYQLYRSFTANGAGMGGVAVEMSVTDFVDNILCGPVGQGETPCLACGRWRRVHVGTFCVECSLGSITTR